MSLGRANIDLLRDTDTGKVYKLRLYDESDNEVTYPEYVIQDVTLEKSGDDEDQSRNKAAINFPVTTEEYKVKYARLVDQSTDPEGIRHIFVYPAAITVPVGEPFQIPAATLIINYVPDDLEAPAGVAGPQLVLFNELGRIPSAWFVGDTVPFVVGTFNHGDEDDTNVVVHFVYPTTQLEYSNASVAPTTPITPGTLEFTIPTSGKDGDFDPITIEMEAKATGTINPELRLISSDEGSTAAAAKRQLTIQSKLAGLLEIEVRFQGAHQTTVYENDKRTFEVLVRETQGRAVSGADFNISTSGWLFLSSASDGGVIANISPPAGSGSSTIQWSDISFLPFENKVFTFVAEFNTKEEFTIQGSITGWDNPGATSFPIQSQVSTVALEALDLDISYTPPSNFYQTGDTIPFQLVVRNLSNQSVHNVQVEQDLPIELQYVGGSANPAPSSFVTTAGGVVTWLLGTMAAGATINISYTLKAAASGSAVSTLATGTGEQATGSFPLVAKNSTPPAVIAIGGTGTLSVDVSIYQPESEGVVSADELHVDSVFMVKVVLTETANSNVSNLTLQTLLDKTLLRLLVVSPHNPPYSIDTDYDGHFKESGILEWFGIEVPALGTKTIYFLAQAIAGGEPNIRVVGLSWDNKPIGATNPEDTLALNVTLDSLEGNFIWS